MPFVLKPCAGNTVFVITYPNSRGFDLKKVAGALKGTEYKVTVETPHILMVKSDSAEITVYSSGKLLVKKAKSRNDAEKLAADFEKWVDGRS